MKILYLTARQPFPVTKGDQIIAYEQIKELSKRHEVYLATFYTDGYEVLISEMNKYCKEIYLFKDNIFKQLCAMGKTILNFNSIQANCYYRYSINRKMKEIYDKINPDIVHVQSFRMAEYFINEDINKSIDLIDAYSLNMLKRAEKARTILKPLWYLEYDLLKRYEQKIIKNYKYKFIVAQRDKDYLNDKSIIVNSNGTNIYDNEKKTRNVDKNINMIFQGNMSYYPNVQAVVFLINELLPKLKNIYPNIKLYVVGSNPSKEILKYKNEDIEITGYVESMKPYLDIADISIYPIFSATGIQNKVLEAMANKIPCIISKEVSLGIPGLINKENILIAENDNDYLKYFKFILNSKNEEELIVSKGYNLIKEKYSWEKHTSIVENIWINEVVKNDENYN